MSDQPEWNVDEYGCIILRTGRALVWIEKRPPYCDRGHYVANVMGIASIDAQDVFPRYYMDLERAKLEMSEWLEWRLQREKNQ